MFKRLLPLSLVGVVALTLSACSAKPAAERAPEARVETVIASAFGSTAAVSTVDTRTLPGRPPTAFYEVSVESTPTAAAAMRVLSALAQAYPDNVYILTVFLPEAQGQGKGLQFRWNTTASTVPSIGDTAPLGPGMLTLSVGIHSGDVTYGKRSDANIVLSPSASQSEVDEAALGRGPLLGKVRERAGLPWFQVAGEARRTSASSRRRQVFSSQSV